MAALPRYRGSYFKPIRPVEAVSIVVKNRFMLLSWLCPFKIKKLKLPARQFKIGAILDPCKLSFPSYFSTVSGPKIPLLPLWRQLEENAPKDLKKYVNYVSKNCSSTANQRKWRRWRHSWISPKDRNSGTRKFIHIFLPLVTSFLFKRKNFLTVLFMYNLSLWNVERISMRLWDFRFNF